MHNNPYFQNLQQHQKDLLYYRHIGNRINDLLQNDIKKNSTQLSKIHLGSALIISDWTGPTDNGWEINFHSGVWIETPHEKYALEIERIISQQLLLLYAQSYESFERFLKDCVFQKCQHDKSIEEFMTNELKLKITNFNRKNMPSGNKLLKTLKFIGKHTFEHYSSHNNSKLDFNKLWTIFAQARHSITHTQSKISLKHINEYQIDQSTLNYLFTNERLSEVSIQLTLDYKKFDRLIKRFSEYGFQYFKIFCISDNLGWE